MLVLQQNLTIERHEFAGGLAALVFAPDSHAEKTPFVFVLHGLGSRKERHLDLCLRLVAAGYRACVLDAPGHGERWHTDYNALSAERTDPAFLRAFGEVVARTVEEVALLATEFSLPHYGVIGHSMGGFTAMHTALADPRASVVVNISGSIDLATIRAKFVQAADFGALIQAADPATHAVHFAPRPVLLLHGDKDELMPLAGARHLYTALKASYGETNAGNVSLIEFPGVGHEFTRDMAEQAVDWMRRFLPSERNHDA